MISRSQKSEGEEKMIPAARIIEPSRVLALDSTAISSWLECHRKYQLAHLEHLIPIGPEAKAFSRGKFVHKLMEVYYSMRMLREEVDQSMTSAIMVMKNWLNNESILSVPKELAEKLMADWEPDKKDLEIPDQTEWGFLTRRFMAYCQYYSDERFVPVALETGFSVPILETGEKFYVLEGRIDAIFREPDSGDLFWADHKSQEREYMFYQNSVQFLNYSIALEATHGMINIFGLQKAEPKSGFFKRQIFKYRDELLSDWKSELVRIYDEIVEAQDYQPEGSVFRKNRGSCKHGLNRQCPFTHICDQTEPAWAEAVKKSEFKQRDPWSPWRISEENGGE